MTPAVLKAFSQELEKMAWDPAGLRDTYAPRVKAHRESVEKKTFVPKAPSEAGYVERPGFFGGVARDLRATARRAMNPRDVVRRVKGSITNPAQPKINRAFQVLGAGTAIANAAPAQDPTGAGKSRIRRALEGAGGFVGGSIGKGLVGGVAGSAAGAAAGNLVGKAFDKVRGYKAPPVKPQEVQA